MHRLRLLLSGSHDQSSSTRSRDLGAERFELAASSRVSADSVPSTTVWQIDGGSAAAVSASQRGMQVSKRLEGALRQATVRLILTPGDERGGGVGTC